MSLRDYNREDITNALKLFTDEELAELKKRVETLNTETGDIKVMFDTWSVLVDKDEMIDVLDHMK